MNRKQVGFLARFAALLLGFYLLVALRPVDRQLVVPFTGGIAAVSGQVLGAVGEEITRTGTILRGDGFAVDLRNGCNGLEAMVFVVAAVLAYPAPWKRRGLGILIGAALIQGVNLIRVTSLYLLGKYRPDLFEVFHVTVWQSVIFGIAILYFLGWTTRARPVADGANS